MFIWKWLFGTSLVAQWVKNPPSNAGHEGSSPAQGTKIPHAGGNQVPAPQLLSPHATTKTQRSQKIKWILTNTNNT